LQSDCKYHIIIQAIAGKIQRKKCDKRPWERSEGMKKGKEKRMSQ
jgi:hypothetical protein